MPIDGVGVTAVAVAAARALECTRAYPLVEDPWASHLVRASQTPVPFPETWPADAAAMSPIDESMLLGATYIALRTRFIDDELRRAALPQVVILGSGLDTRSWRLDWLDGTAVFELDSPPVVAFVDTTMTKAGATARCRRVPIDVDVTGPWAARAVAAGFRPNQPAHWVLEGLLPYLASHDQRALLQDVIDLSAPGSRAVIERAPQLTDTPETRERLRTFALTTGIPMDELLARTDPPDPAAVLAEAGWDVTPVPASNLETRYARPLQIGRDAAAVPPPQRGGFVTARRPD
jgi:methyltransferase (TIGR00027 family)